MDQFQQQRPLPNATIVLVLGGNYSRYRCNCIGSKG
jgi:hypothetical protein